MRHSRGGWILELCERWKKKRAYLFFHRIRLFSL
jgi:hypothetical protein